jgi:hypothetical protein
MRFDISTKPVYALMEVDMLLFDDAKKLEKALGEEATSVIAHVLERADGAIRQELATKTDLQGVRVEMQVMRTELKDEIAAVRVELKDEIAAAGHKIDAVDRKIDAVKHDLLRWLVGGFITQTALLLAVMALSRQ